VYCAAPRTNSQVEDLSRFRVRILVASIVVVLAFLLLASRLVYLQVVRHD
jgi:penicillin-binding protein 2